MPLSKNSRRGLKYNVRSPGWNIGERHGNSKLTEDDVRRIKRLIDEDELTFADIAQAFGVTTGTVSHIHTGRLWSHVTAYPATDSSALSKTSEETNVAVANGTKTRNVP